MIQFLSAGLLLGLSAGFSPGPLLTLVISQTLQHGIREGIKVALAPLITDLPIIGLSLLVLTRLTNFRTLLGVISILGGLFVLHLAYGSLRIKKLDQPVQDTAPQSLSKGALVNALSPHPYIFWLTVGSPIILKARGDGLLPAIGFIAGFLGSLVGAKIILAVLSGKSRHLLSDRLYRIIMQVLGVLLAAFAGLLLKDGLELMGLLAF
ncbi:MAG: LysE family transporter [Pseudomonadota bacterium]